MNIRTKKSRTLLDFFGVDLSPKAKDLIVAWELNAKQYISKQRALGWSDKEIRRQLLVQLVGFLEKKGFVEESNAIVKKLNE